MKKQLDMVKIAKGLGALRRGKVHAKAGYFGALALVAALSKTTEQLSEDDAERLIRRRRAGQVARAAERRARPWGTPAGAPTARR